MRTLSSLILLCVITHLGVPGVQNRVVHLSNLSAWFGLWRRATLPHEWVRQQPYEALQARARKDHTSFSWYFDDWNLDGASAAAVQKDVAIVFLQSDSGEDYITVDGNTGDR
jgi:hypothetical protein